MNRTLALQNALGTICYINTAHPEMLSSFTNYTHVYYVEVQVNPEEFNVYDLRDEINGFLVDVDIEIVYITTINRDILRIRWRGLEEEKK